MCNQIIPGWYDTPNTVKALGGISRAAIAAISKAEGWQSVMVGNGAARLHRAEDVHEYRDHQIRTRLAKVLGWKGRGLCRIDDIDISCPVCEDFAIEWPPPPYLDIQWVCINGHKG